MGKLSKDECSPFWLLATGYWLLATGYWLLVFVPDPHWNLVIKNASRTVLPRAATIDFPSGEISARIIV
jgi:hypothetical protein